MIGESWVVFAKRIVQTFALYHQVKLYRDHGPPLPASADAYAWNKIFDFNLFQQSAWWICKFNLKKLSIYCILAGIKTSGRSCPRSKPHWRAWSCEVKTFSSRERRGIDTKIKLWFPKINSGNAKKIWNWKRNYHEKSRRGKTKLGESKASYVGKNRNGKMTKNIVWNILIKLLLS